MRRYGNVSMMSTAFGLPFGMETMLPGLTVARQRQRHFEIVVISSSSLVLGTRPAFVACSTNTIPTMIFPGTLGPSGT